MKTLSMKWLAFILFVVYGFYTIVVTLNNALAGDPAADEKARLDNIAVEKYFYQQTVDDAFREYKGAAQTCMNLVRANSPYAPSVCADAQTKRRHLEP